MSIHKEDDRWVEKYNFGPASNRSIKKIKEERRYTFQQMIDFAKWYSGMDEAKVIAAYARYLREKPTS